MRNRTRLGPLFHIFRLRAVARASALLLAALAAPLGAATPVSQFTWRPDNPTAGASVQFTDESSNAPTSWSWDFGDGGSASVQNPAHVFSRPGAYRVKLTSSNTSGHSLGEHTVTVGGSASD